MAAMMMRLPNMMDVGGIAGFPGMGQMGGGMPMGHPHIGGNGGVHGKPASGMPRGGYPHMGGAGMHQGCDSRGTATACH